MNTNRPPEEIAFALARRSPNARFKIGAVLADSHGIFAWGWNHQSPSILATFLSDHAEWYAFRNSNRKRLRGATLYVAGTSQKGKPIRARPCESCWQLVEKYGIAKVIYSTPQGFVVLKVDFKPKFS